MRNIICDQVCRNGSFHLRGNVYIQYKSLDSAVMAYNSVHGRYFASKQVFFYFFIFQIFHILLSELLSFSFENRPTKTCPIVYHVTNGALEF